MNIERERRIHTYLALALDQPAEDRVSYLTRICDEDSELEDVLELLGLESEINGFMEEPVWKGMPKTSMPDLPRPVTDCITVLR